MKTSMKTVLAIFTGLAMASLLSACGGGNDDVVAVQPAQVKEAPSSAAASVGGFLEFTTKVIAETEAEQPWNVSAMVPPTSEIDAPVTLK